MGASGQEGRDRMRILHLKNVAGYASRLAQAQRQLGHDAVVWSRGETYGFPYDTLMPSGPQWNLWMLRRWTQLHNFDVLHIHGGIYRGEVFYPLFKRLTEIRTIVHYHGTESRLGGGLYHRKVADKVFFTPPDLWTYHPGGMWIPQPIDLPEPVETFEHDVPMFAHFAGTSKGTSLVIEMFNRTFGPLRHTRLDFPQGGHKDFYIGNDAGLWVLTGIPYNGVLQVMKRADVVFDQIAPFGIYGYVAVEAMALGRPVLATVDRSLYPSDCPVIYPRETKLMELAHDAASREHYCKLGRAYAERVHEASVVARLVLDAYF